MRKGHFIFVMSVTTVFLLFFSSSALPFEGPLQVKNQFPLFLFLNSPRLESASTETSFSAGISHSSVFMLKDSSEWSVNLDMEITELALRYRKDIPHIAELGLEVPFVSFESGFMDSFLESYHKAFGFSDYGRSSRPHNEFLFEVRRNGALIIKGKEGRTGLGDIRLTAKKVVLSGDPVVSVRADIQLPTGDASAGFGAGSLNAGATLLLDKRISEKFITYWNVGAGFPGDLKAKDTVTLKTFVHAGAGIEAALWKSFSLLGQIEFQTSPYPETGIGRMDRISALFSFGGRYLSGKNSFEFSLTEDPNTAGAPDVTFNFIYKRNF